MKATSLGGQPDFVQGFLQVDHHLAAIGKGQGNHTADPLAIDIRVRIIIDAVTTSFDRLEQSFCTVHEFRVVHYNFTMLITNQILVRWLVLAACAFTLTGCGQTGSLYLPTRPASATPAPLAARPATVHSAGGHAVDAGLTPRMLSFS